MISVNSKQFKIMINAQVFYQEVAYKRVCIESIGQEKVWRNATKN